MEEISAAERPASVELVVKNNSIRNASLTILAILSASALLLTFVYFTFPHLEPHELPYFKLPRNIEDAKNLGLVLSNYTNRYFLTVFIGYILTYIFLQSFAIPGSIFLSILSGFLFPFPVAILTVCMCSAIGASNCYLLSMICGRPFIVKYWPDRTAKWAEMIRQHRGHLLNYIIFLRITPLLPNWFINLTSPILDVPLKIFFVATFIGVAPPSFVAIHAGTTLHQLSASSGIVSPTSILILAIFAALSILPIVFKNKLQEKFKNS